MCVHPKYRYTSVGNFNFVCRWTDQLENVFNFIYLLNLQENHSLVLKLYSHNYSTLNLSSKLDFQQCCITKSYRHNSHTYQHVPIVSFQGNSYRRTPTAHPLIYYTINRPWET